MGSRLDLHEELVSILGSRNVYYQGPGDIRMSYPCIVYFKETIDSEHADNIKYITNKRYQLTLISRTPDDEVIDKLLLKDYSEFVRHFISDNLHHTVINLYY